jgi:hypothetical protein
MNPLEQKIENAAKLGYGLECLIATRGTFVIGREKRDALVMAYWSLITEYFRGAICLMRNDLWAPAFALLRPTVEALVQCCMSHAGPEDFVDQIKAGRYRVSYEKDGGRIDQMMGTGKLYEKYLKSSRDILHNLAHSGPAQLNMRFSGNDLTPSYTMPQKLGLIAHVASTVFLLALVTAMAFNYGPEYEQAQHLWIEYGDGNLSG